MLARRRHLVLLLVSVLVLAVTPSAWGQPDPFNFQFSSGQSVGPIFDGWSHNPDGTFDMHFGYINRNHVEELHVPIGPDNVVEPGDLDQKQPTFFYPRVYRKVFSVTVPRDWGDRELVWSVTVRGQRQQAIGWLDPVWEIEPILNGRTPTEEQKVNQAPTLALQLASERVTLPNSLALTATVSDDGVPKARSVRLRARGQETPPTLQPAPGDPKAPINVPSLRTAVRPSEVDAGSPLAITWTVHRGPASVTVEGDGVQGDSVSMQATFTEPGEYILRAELSDGHLADVQDVAVTVSPGP